MSLWGRMKRVLRKNGAREPSEPLQQEAENVEKDLRRRAAEHRLVNRQLNKTALNSVDQSEEVTQVIRGVLSRIEQERERH